MNDELLEITTSLRQQTENFRAKHSNAIKAIMNAAEELEKSWSGSNLGYHTYVYYEGFRPPPPEAQFSVMFGLQKSGIARLDGHGNWRQYSQTAHE